ncbi:MAG: NAD(P)H-binding protein [Actinomycetota bacterium]|nr:NAD(P)H-binding protein [Actinomycetota bacterium]
MKIVIVGGTGFLGYYAMLEALRRGYSVRALAIDDINLDGWYPEEVNVGYGNVFELSEENLQEHFSGYDAMVYALGPDDRITPPAPAYDFFHTGLVVSCEKTIIAACRAGIKKCVVLNSYFAYFDRIWPEKQLSKHHPYIKCRVEQAERAIAAGGDKMAVMILELPYIFGCMPNRIPLWKDVLLDRFLNSRAIFFPGGGTNMIAVEHVGEAIVGCLEHGVHGERYLVGDENHSYSEMLEMMMSSLGIHKKIINIPRFAAVLAGIMINMSRKRKGLEGGLDARYLMRDILTHDLFYDPSSTAKKLGYKRGGLKESIFATMRACYPEKFKG